MIWGRSSSSSSSPGDGWKGAWVGRYGKVHTADPTPTVFFSSHFWSLLLHSMTLSCPFVSESSYNSSSSSPHDLYVPIYPSLSSLLHWFSTYGSRVSSTSCRRFRRDGGCEWGEGFRFSPLSVNWFFTTPTKCRTWILIPWTVSSSSSSSSSSTCLLSPGGSWWGAGVQCFWRPEPSRISACKMSRSSSSSTSSGATSLFQQHCWYTIYKERAGSSERICCCSVSTTLSRVEKRKNYCCLRLQAGG